MDGGKENRRGRVHAKDLRTKQKHKDANNPPVAKRPVVLPQQPLPDPAQLPDVDVVAGDNFNDLVSQSGTAGGRFVLKSERDWNKDITLGSGSDQFSHLFELDVQQLAQAIVTIPFHERFDLDDVTLTDGIKELFTREAEEKLKAFTKTGGQSAAPQKAPIAKEESPCIQSSEMPLRILPKSPVEVVNDPDPKEDIQGWLDDVLDL